MFSLSVIGDGGCLFTSLGVSLKTYRYLDYQPDLNVSYKKSQLTGLSDGSKHSGFQIRMAIIQWYMDNLQKELPLLGKIIETEQKKWKAIDILNLELARYADIDDDIKEQSKNIYKYLYHMTQLHSWGSTPEYIAFSLIFDIPVRVWRKEGQEIILNDTFPNETKIDDKGIDLLFVHGNHYEPLLSEKNKEVLNLKYGKDLGAFYNKHYTLKM